MRKRKTGMLMLLTFMLALFTMTGAAFAEEAGEAAAEETKEETSFSQWNPEAPSLQALIDYVEAVTDEASPDYIPPEDRIATFDMDGTLIGELFPTYMEVILLENRILRDANYTPDAEMLEFGRMTREHAPDKSFPDDYDYQFSYHQARAFEGMTIPEYNDFITQVLQGEADGFEGMTYAQAYYLPMAQVVKYLQENGFTCYIVTGSDRFIARAFMELQDAMDFTDENIIGSDTALKAKDQGDTDGIEYEFTVDDTLVRTDQLLIKDLKTNKVVQIAQEIGKQPVLSFGNSSGDVSMNNYALYNNPYKSAAFQLIADDDVRDYGHPEKGEELREKWEGMGFNVISMRDDWKTIYGEDVKKTGQFTWAEDFAEDLVPAEAGEDEEGYTLDRTVLVSRHNIRSPLSGSGSLLGDITPHEWFAWTSNPSELSLRGGILETEMGQYFRQWLEEEGLFPENYRPEEGAVRFYANAKQRTQATAKYFSSGLLPVTNVPIECNAEYDTMDPTFNPQLTFLSEAYEQAVKDQVNEKGGSAGMAGIHEELKDAIAMLMDVTDMDESETYQAGTYGNLLEDPSSLILEIGKEPGMSGPIKTATSVADALTFQFYEMDDDKAAAFGHDLTIEDWRKLHTIVDTYTDILFGTPLLAVNEANPLLKEIRSEMEADGRKFSFLCGHDSNLAGVLSALGVEEYLLPNTVEQHTPIGAKLVFSRYLDKNDEPYWSVELVYQNTDQLKNMSSLTLDNPPERYALDFTGVAKNEDGLIAEADLFAMFDNAFDAYDALLEKYGAEELDNAA